jgi:hypothetical protein
VRGLMPSAAETLLFEFEQYSFAGCRIVVHVDETEFRNWKRTYELSFVSEWGSEFRNSVLFCFNRISLE